MKSSINAVLSLVVVAPITASFGEEPDRFRVSSKNIAAADASHLSRTPRWNSPAVQGVQPASYQQTATPYAIQTFPGNTGNAVYCANGNGQGCRVSGGPHSAYGSSAPAEWIEPGTLQNASFWVNDRSRALHRKLYFYQRMHHRHFLNPVSPPHCHPTSGYHETQWRSLDGSHYTPMTPGIPPTMHYPQQLQQLAPNPMSTTPNAPAPAEDMQPNGSGTGTSGDKEKKGDPKKAGYDGQAQRVPTLPQINVVKPLPGRLPDRGSQPLQVPLPSLDPTANPAATLPKTLFQ